MPLFSERSFQCKLVGAAILLPPVGLRTLPACPCVFTLSTEVSIACGKSARSRGCAAPPATMALLFGDGLAYEWGTDWPETFDVLSMSKQHRPLSQKLSPLGVMEELNKLYQSSQQDLAPRVHSCVTAVGIESSRYFLLADLLRDLHRESVLGSYESVRRIG